MWNRESLIWAAGILEGEGSFSVGNKTHLGVNGYPEGKKYPNIKIRCSMTDEDIITHLKEALIFGSVTGPYQRNPLHKPLWRYACYKKSQVFALGVALYPWMGERRKAQIRKQIEVFRIMPGSGNYYQKGAEEYAR